MKCIVYFRSASVDFVVGLVVEFFDTSQAKPHASMFVGDPTFGFVRLTACHIVNCLLEPGVDIGSFLSRRLGRSLCRPRRGHVRQGLGRVVLLRPPRTAAESISLPLE